MKKSGSLLFQIIPAVLCLSLIPAPAFAADPLPLRYSSADTIWVLLGAALVFFMQPGFAMCETGLTRAKNAGNIVMKNVMDFALGTPVFWIIGFDSCLGQILTASLAVRIFLQHILPLRKMPAIPPWHF